MNTKIKAVLLGLCMVSLVGCGVNVKNGGGKKIGQIVKVSKVGFINKTWEIELVRGGLNGGSGTIGVAPFHCTLPNSVMAQDAEKFMNNQTEVILEYDTPLFFGLTSTETGSFATRITPNK